MNAYQKLCRIGLYAGLGGLLGGCATTDDPREGGILGGIYGLSSGAYEERVQQREGNLESLRRVQSGGEAEQRALQQEQAQQAAELASLRAQSQRLESEVGALSKQIQQTEARTSSAQQRKQALNKKAKALQTDVQKLQKQVQSAPSADVGKYQAEEKRLLKEIEGLKKDLHLLQ